MLRTGLVDCVIIVASFSVVRAEDDPLKELGERYAAQQKRYWPTLFLIDHNGVIIDRQTDRSYGGLKKAIDTLLAAQRADPNADEQLKTHPLPELPILKRTE